MPRIRNCSKARWRLSPPRRSTWMIVHMWRAGRRMKGDIEGRLQSSSLTRRRRPRFPACSCSRVLMISREGMETALLLMQLRETLEPGRSARPPARSARPAVAWLWSRYGHRVNLALFFQVTAIFLFVFVVQLVIRGVHEMSEQAMLPYSDVLHDKTEAWGPDSPFGHLLTYLLVLLPLAGSPSSRPSSRGRSPCRAARTGRFVRAARFAGTMTPGHPLAAARHSLVESGGGCQAADHRRSHLGRPPRVRREPVPDRAGHRQRRHRRPVAL